MNSEMWKRFPVIQGFRCLDMKDGAQTKVIEDTRRIAPTALIAYFQGASRRFWQETGRLTTVRFKTPVNTIDSEDRGSGFVMGVAQRPVEWAFSRKG